MWWLMVYVTAWACWKGYRSLKNDQGWFQRRDWYICRDVCVCQKSGSTREKITWICLCGLAQTHIHTTSLFYPWYVISVLLNRRHSYRTGQDIENCGTCRDCACIIYRYVAGCNARISAYLLLVFTTWAARVQLHVSAHSCVCISVCAPRCHFESRQFSGSSVFMAW